MAMNNHQYIQDGHPTLRRADREAIGVALQAVMIDLIDLAMLGKQAHWTIVGSRFRSLDLHLDNLVSECHELADRAAERSVTLGVTPDGQVRTIAERTEIAPLPCRPLRDHEVLGAMADRLIGVVARVRKRMEQVAEYDRVTEHLLIEAVAKLEAQLWTLRAWDDVPIAVDAGNRVVIRR